MSIHKKRYELIVFDWEGTLGDTLGRVMNCINLASAELNLPLLEKESLSKIIDRGLNAALHHFYPDISDDTMALFQQKIYLFQAKQQADEPLIDGAMTLMKLLHEKGILIGVASSRGKQSLLNAIEESGLQPFVSAVRSAQDTMQKPHPQMLEEIIQQSGVTNDSVLMVGDSLCDIEMAEALNVDSIGVDFYNLGAEKLHQAGALGVINDYRQLIDYIDLENR
jgi:phosphoglycolate phosphatase